MSILDDLEHRLTLTTAVARYEALRIRESLGDPGTALSQDEALELLALSEVIIRKTGYGRQISVRNARAAGASWALIGLALGMSRQSAWEAHTRWIDGQVNRRGTVGHGGFDDQDAAEARRLAGTPDDES